ncbi:helix-turn-helix domain-containing protein [Actinomadura rubrisoli]|uniref:Helix-turn-helix domain-containing protein n=1 Tax=Actinomadura rubrisoli TaxID=2530368 RepID=A0A4R5B5J6_9ACTN|nr:helix-turn-helix transcriptional regulator [Actinomadura rubrisoli]TDD81508.1 helix-turn-helix domain-containing protein [Actinomadura rubrisoli]
MNADRRTRARTAADRQRRSRPRAAPATQARSRTTLTRLGSRRSLKLLRRQEGCEPMHDEMTIGARLRTLRRWRGMSLAQLAGLSGLSKGFLSKIENGKAALGRRSHISAIATALRISEADLIGGPHLTADPVRAAPHATVPAVRAALMTNSLTAPAADHARPLAELVAEMGRIDRSEYKHIEVGQKLPALIDELHVHACAPTDEPAYRLALETLVEAFQAATFTSKDLGHGDLAHVAAMRAAEVAAILDDPVVTGKAASLRIHTMPTTARDVALTAAEHAANALEPHVHDDLGVQVLGMLTLAASMTATVIYDYDRAEHWMRQADEQATRVPDTPGLNWGAFSKTNVGVWKVALATERGASSGDLLGLAKNVDEAKLEPRRGRHATFLADVGRGLARDKRTHKDAAGWLLRAEEVAPHKIRNSAAVGETVATLVRQTQGASLGRELRGLAARMGIPH